MDDGRRVILFEEVAYMAYRLTMLRRMPPSGIPDHSERAEFAIIYEKVYLGSF
jgi:hypothetical protein